MSSHDRDQFKKGFEFDFMARRPMYAVCPTWLLAKCDIGPNSAVADVGCGSGIFTQFLLDRFHDAPHLRIVAVDPSEHELAIMKSRIGDDRVTFVNGFAQDAATIVSDVQAAVLCNVLHQIPLVERASVLEGIFELLAQGGFVGANTLFYDGGIPPGTETFYIVWMMHARKVLKELGVVLDPPRATPVALQRLSPEQHRNMLKDVGFIDVVIEEIELDWTIADWEALSRYSVFIRGALQPDIDLELGNRALVEGVRSAYQDLAVETVPRGWLHCAARRP